MMLTSASACAYDRRIPRPPKVELWVAETTIAASPEKVWEVITDFEAYAEWNPWLIEATGSAVVDGRVDARVRLGERVRRAKHRVFLVEQPRRLCWRDAGFTTLFATGSRCRTLEADGAGGTRLRVELRVGGGSRRMVRRKYDEALREGLEAEIRALARRAAR